MGKIGKAVLAAMLVCALMGILTDASWCKEEVSPGAKVLQGSIFAEEALVDGQPSSKILQKYPRKEPPGFKSLPVRKEFIPPAPQRKGSTSQQVQAFSSSTSLGLWRVYAIHWDLTAGPVGAAWIDLLDPMYVVVTDGAIGVTRTFPGPRLIGTYYYSYVFTNGTTSVYLDWQYKVLSDSWVQLWASVNHGPYVLQAEAFFVPSVLILETGIILEGGIARGSDSILEQKVVGTWTVTENTTFPVFFGEIGKFDIRMLAIKKLKTDPACFNPEGKDPKAPEVARYFTNITGNVHALPVSTTLFPSGWSPLDDTQWIVMMLNADSSLVQFYTGSSPTQAPDAEGKVADFKQRWEGQQFFSAEKAPDGGYTIWTRARGLLRFATVTRWKDVASKVALHVPYFNQATGAWGPLELDRAGYDRYGLKTMARKGCAVTSAAMVLKFHQINKSPDGKDTDPLTLNEWLNKTPGGFSAGNINWTAAFNKYSGGRIVRIPGFIEGTGKIAALDSELAAKHPPILFVPEVGPHHWVVPTAKCKDTWTINDPAQWIGAPQYTTTLKERDFANSFDAGVRVRPGSSSTSQDTIDIFLGSSGELLLIDPQGRRTGYDPVTKTIVKEIPESGYLTMGLIDPTTGATFPPRKELSSSLPLKGAYTLQVIGVKEETVKLSIYTLDALLVDSFFEKELTLVPGAILRYRINFQGNGLPTEVKEVSVSIPSIRQAVQAAYKAGKIDNQGLMTSLVQKLDAAQAALDRKQPDVVKNILGAFINEVEAQKGKHITKEVAESLIRDTQDFLSELR